jgi:hypothetical protein
VTGLQSLFAISTSHDADSQTKHTHAPRLGSLAQQGRCCLKQVRMCCCRVGRSCGHLYIHRTFGSIWKTPCLTSPIVKDEVRISFSTSETWGDINYSWLIHCNHPECMRPNKFWRHGLTRHCKNGQYRMIHGIADVTLAQELGYWTIQNIFPSRFKLLSSLIFSYV